MFSPKLVVIACVLGAAPAAIAAEGAGCTTRGALEVKDEIQQKRDALARAESAVGAASERASAAGSLLARIRELAQSHSVAEARLQEAVRDEALARLALREARSKLDITRLEKKRLESEAGCLEGKPTSPAELAALHHELEVARKGMAEIALARAEVRLAFQEFETGALKQLAASGAIDPRVAKEAESESRARLTEVEGAKRALDTWSKP